MYIEILFPFPKAQTFGASYLQNIPPVVLRGKNNTGPCCSLPVSALTLITGKRADVSQEDTCAASLYHRASFS
jgi:hypothetical protein